MSANMKMSIDCQIIYKLNEKKILKYNIQMVKLEDYTTTELKKMISSFNKIVKFGGYSKLKKAELITMIRTHPKVKVEEGANAVKLSIKTDEDFEKQKKVKKEKVKKEVKKEVEKLDDVKVVVKPVEKKEEPEKKKEEPEKKKKKIKFNVKAKKNKEKAVDDLFKQIKKSYEKNKPKLDKMSIKKYKAARDKILNQLYEDVGDIYEEKVNHFERNDLNVKLSEIIPLDKPKKKATAKKQEPKNEQELYREQKKELDEKTLNMILKEDKDILLKPSEVDDPKQTKKIKKLYKKVFETYKKSYGDLLDKYDFSKSNYRKDASNNFNLFIRRARQQPKKE